MKTVGIFAHLMALDLFAARWSAANHEVFNEVAFSAMAFSAFVSALVTWRRT